MGSFKFRRWVWILELHLRHLLQAPFTFSEFVQNVRLCTVFSDSFDLYSVLCKRTTMFHTHIKQKLNYKIKIPTFRVCKSVHHHTFNWINQPDASISQICCLSFKYSSTRSTGKPEAVTAVYKLLMTCKRMPETRWAVFKRRTKNLRDWCIWLVDLFECISIVHYCTLWKQCYKKICVLIWHRIMVEM